MIFMIVFIAVAVCIRLVSLFVSVRNERALKRNGATEHGTRISALLALAHILFYAAAIFEYVRTPEPVTILSIVGMAIYFAAMAMLFYVIRVLGKFWTVRLIIANDHTLNTTPLFRLVRHPNYFLNIIPELFGLTLALHAYETMSFGIPIYIVILGLRIHQEEKIMQATFSNY